MLAPIPAPLRRLPRGRSSPATATKASACSSTRRSTIPAILEPGEQVAVAGIGKWESRSTEDGEERRRLRMTAGPDCPVLISDEPDTFR